MSLRRNRWSVIAAAWPQLALAALVGGGIALGLAAPLRVVYAAAAVVIGAYLERRDTPRYVSFVIWLWFLSPLVRRLADLHGGWQDPSLVLLTPYLVTALSVPPLLRGLLRPERRAALRVAGVGVFAIAGAGVAIGIPAGMLIGPSRAALETLNWFLPLCFGWYVATRDVPAHRIEAAVATTFVAAALVAGTYGLYQFTSPPLWDINWMQRSEMESIGSPEPFAVRVFGPMHSPGVFSAFLVIALASWLARPRASGMVAAGVAGVALLLSQVRSAWLALAIAALLLVGSLTVAQRFRMAMLAVAATALAGPLLFTAEMRELVNSRVATMERLENDDSAVARMIGHQLALEFVAEHPLGAGIGQSDPDMEQYISMRDSVVASSLVQFGLFGTLLYVGALCGVTWLLWSYHPARRLDSGRRARLGRARAARLVVAQPGHRRTDRRGGVDDRRAGDP